MWYVYQFHSDVQLLYVGYTRYLKRRIGQHKRLKSWWPEVTGIRSEEFGTEDEARRREKELWAGGRPKYNRHNPFLTPEEERAKHRELERRPDQAARKRERAQAYGQTAAGRAVRAEYMRKFRQRSRQQAGPGLF